MIGRLAIEGYRSIRSLVVDLEPLTVVTGPNGSGKSNLYRALRLLADCGAGRVVPSLAASGGLDGVLWAGPETISAAVLAGAPAQGLVRQGPVALRLGFGGDELGYAVDLGLPVPSGPTMFARDPVLKQEHVFAGLEPRPASTLARRAGPLAQSRGDDGWVELSRTLAPWDSLLDELPGSDAAPEIAGARRILRAWRFHDALRTDAHAPARQPQVATRAVRLDDDGANLAAVLQTTIESRADGTVERAIEEGFQGSRLEIVAEGGRMRLALRQPGMLRALEAPELSDGTMQYLLLVAALTSVERPGLLVLNEPERSLHDDLLPALAARIRDAADETQVVVVTHSRVLADALGGARVELERAGGETLVAGREGPLDVPAWRWPSR
ncbi:AAA family ATPase [Agrococcus sp. SGAir0287]|uniref:AAA family ATPase n=1 Tax=Agrococcus sp. SGAir0287 TaxID=2070347 RepID=UPI0010CD5FAF|nr:AAA family ATPase [Agrococcus sp. SGAir0287]QCR19006.1 ATP-binding protein [Agrococcus sp. SGAir0287]